MNTYARARRDRLAEVAEALGTMALSGKKRVTCVSRQVAGADTDLRNSLETQRVTTKRGWWRRGESNPRPVTVQ